MNFTDLFTPRAIAEYWTSAGNVDGYLGAALFPARKQASLDLSWFVGADGLPISLMPSAFDAKATFRDRIGLTKIETEMPFFREGFKIKERDRQELLRARDAGDPYLVAALDRIFDDAGNLLKGANVVPERMRMSLLFPVSGNMTIDFIANGMTYSYDYDANGTWKATNYTALTSTAKWDAPATADPVADLQTAKNAIRQATGADANIAIMNGDTFAKLCACQSVIARVPNTVYITDAEARRVLEVALGVSIIVDDEMYRDEAKTAHKFVPDGYVALVPNVALGQTVYGTTPEEADLMGGGSDAEVAIVNTGVAITRIIEEHPVNVNTFASEIVLPSFERMNDVYVLNVY